jgi:hypothetical protein
VLGKYRPEHVCTKTAGSEGSYEDIRVEANPHDTSRKTSSSVR